jgi:HK97 family phage major capsid protein
MKSILYYLRLFAAITCVTAYNLLKASPFGAAPLALCLEDNDFEIEVLDGVRAIGKRQETILADVTRLDGQTRKAIEELTKIKNQGNDIAGFKQQLDRVNLLLKSESCAAFGSPFQRLLANEEGCARLNYLFRKIAHEHGDGPAKGMDFWKGKTLDLTTEPGSTYFQAGYLKELYDTLAEYGAWSSLGVRQMSTKITKMPVKTARPIAYFKKPGTRQIVDDTAKAGTAYNLEVELIGVLITVYLELLQDSEFDISADILGDFIEAFNLRLDNAAFMGAGTDAPETNGLGDSFIGLFHYAGAVTADATHTTVATMKYTDVLKCLTGVAPIVLARKARWWIHPTMLARMIGIQDGVGRPIFQSMLEAPSYGSLGTILGYPITPVYIGPNTDGASQPVVAFGDPNTMVVGVRTDFNFEASDDFKFDTFERAFRGTGRAGVMGRRTDGATVLKLAAS